MTVNNGLITGGPAHPAPEAAIFMTRPQDQEEGKKPDNDFLDLLGHVRDIRVEAQNLQKLWDILKQKTKIDEAAPSRQETEGIPAEWQIVNQHSRDKINFHFREIRQILDRNSELYDGLGDEIACMEKSWDYAAVSWPVHKKKEDVPGDIRLSAKVEEALREIIFHAGYITIPNRVNQHLKKKWIGQHLDFHRTFADELSDDEERQEILKRLYDNPLSIDGIIDLDSGLIFRIGKKIRRRVLSYVCMVSLFLLGGLLAFFLAKVNTWLGIKSWFFGAFTERDLVCGYLAVMTGGVVHLGFTALKQHGSSGKQSFVALGNWFLWGHVKEKSILGSIIWIWIVYLGYLFTVKKIDLPSLFFVGYSFDSFIDLFLKRFQILAAKKIEAVKKEITA